MTSFPHQYTVEASASSEGLVTLSAEGLEALSTAPPAEFGGPGDRWSPESLLVAAVADCFVLTFRAVATASSLEWTTLRCEAEGVLDRVDRTTRFTGMRIQAHLELPAGVDPDRGGRLLEKAEKGCLITNSLVCPVELLAHVSAG